MRGSDNPFPSVLLVEGTTPATPSAGRARLYVDVADGLLKWVDEAGAVQASAASDHTHDASTTITATQQAGTAYTLALADAGTVVEFTSASAVTLTVPANAAVAFPTGTVIEVYVDGAGGVTVAGDTGVTVRNAGALAQYATASLRKRATDEWVLTGDVT